MDSRVVESTVAGGRAAEVRLGVGGGGGAAAAAQRGWSYAPAHLPRATKRFNPPSFVPVAPQHGRRPQVQTAHRPYNIGNGNIV